WIWNNIAPDIRVKRNMAGPRTYKEAAAAWRKDGLQMQSVVPLSPMDSIQDVAPYYYEWLRHPPDDRWWDWADLTGKYNRTNAAILNLSGWYADNYGPEGATTNFLGLVAARGGRPKDTALLIGPWVHGVDSTATPKGGERELAEKSKIDYDRVVLDWMDHYLRDVDNGVGGKPPVRYYVMGAEVWREGRSWPPKATPTNFYLDRAQPGSPGVLTTSRPTAGGYSAFVSDPTHPVENQYKYSGAHEYRYLTS